jgi:NADH-quinone oxidoreductase subunit E
VSELADKYPEEIAQILAKYPAESKQAAVMPMLYLAQRETGYLTQAALQEIADLLGVTKTEVATIVGFYTLYHDTPAGKYRIQVCTDLPCALRGADKFLEELCENLAITVGQTTADGMITLETVTCLAGCNKAPLFQVQTGEGITYHENQTVKSALEFVAGLRRREPGRTEQALGEKEARP